MLNEAIRPVRKVGFRRAAAERGITVFVFEIKILFPTTFGRALAVTGVFLLLGLLFAVLLVGTFILWTRLLGL